MKISVRARTKTAACACLLAWCRPDLVAKVARKKISASLFMDIWQHDCRDSAKVSKTDTEPDGIFFVS